MARRSPLRLGAPEGSESRRAGQTDGEGLIAATEPTRVRSAQVIILGAAAALGYQAAADYPSPEH